MSRLKGNIAVVGIGEVPTGRYPERDCMDGCVTSAVQAIADAGIDKNEIDCVVPCGTVFSGAYNSDLVTSRVVEELGLSRVHNNVQVFSGGASSASMLKVAGSLVQSGMARHVLCVHSEKLGTGLSGQAGIDLFALAGIHREWEVPFGQHYSTIAGLVTTRYKYETGTTDEQITAVQVSNRKWAELNPNAMFRKPLTVEEVMKSKMLATPIRAKHSNMLADGAAAFIVTSAERAKDLTETPVYVLGSGGRVTHHSLSQEADITRFGYAEAAADAFEEAGLSPKDIDIAEIYDSYPIFEIIALEEMGFVERGKGGAFFLEGRTWPGGELPTTTNGGMSSQGHTGGGGGFAILVEAVRQLMGKAEKRQVPDARFAAVTATGGTYVDAQVEILGNEIS
ncbi:MAG: thiolase family protein [Desulfobacteraceae bacterium]|nr:thiolase family protein [Desulfobacteraceae bacterium]